MNGTDNDADICAQPNRAVATAHRNGSAIAIGHPHPATVHVLQQTLLSLPGDIVLVRPGMLLNERLEPGTATAPMGKPALSHRPPFRDVPHCSSYQSPLSAHAGGMINAIALAVNRKDTKPGEEML